MPWFGFFDQLLGNADRLRLVPNRADRRRTARHKRKR
jgi:hypothetical protein